MSARARRRGGRGRRRPTRPAPPPRRSFWQRLLGWLGLGARPKPAPAPARPRRGGEPVGEQEAQVFREFSRTYGIPFQDVSLLKLALTHRSYLSVTGQGARESNERLEFLGDSVLGLVTSEFLYRRHPDEHEGHLTKVKSLLVSKAILSRRALKMGLGRFVLMSHSEVESGGRQRLSILADAFESVLGAVYLDQGFETARKFIHDHLLSDADAIVADKRHTNYKSHLQEYVQSTYRTHPVYRIRSEYGPDHSKHFLVEVMVGRRMLGEGRGHNKKEAEQAAARDAIERVTELRREASEGRRTDRTTEPAAAAASTEPEAREADSPRRGRRRRGGRDRDARRDDEAAVPGASVEAASASAGLAARTAELERARRAERAEAEAERELEEELELEDDEETDEIELDTPEEDRDDEDLDDEDLDDAPDDASEDEDDDSDDDEADDDESEDDDDVDAEADEPPSAAPLPTAGRPEDHRAAAPIRPVHAPSASRASAPPSYGRGRRMPRPAPPVESRPGGEPAGTEEQRHVDPFAHESRADEPRAWAAPPEPESAPVISPEPDDAPAREAQIDEMERAMENFGRRSRPGRRRRSR